MRWGSLEDEADSVLSVPEGDATTGESLDAWEAFVDGFGDDWTY